MPKLRVRNKTISAFSLGGPFFPDTVYIWYRYAAAVHCVACPRDIVYRWTWLDHRTPPTSQL